MKINSEALKGAIEVLKKHWPKLVAFIAGWASDALIDLTGYLKALIEGLAK